MSEPAARFTRSNGARRALCGGIAALAVLSVLGCSHNARPAAGGPRLSTTAAAPSSEPSTDPTSPASTRTAAYAAPQKGCRDVDTASLGQSVGPTKRRIEQVSHNTAMTSAHCAIFYGSFVLNVETDVAKDASGELLYNGLRGAQEKKNRVTDVAGVGSGAYSFTDPQTGPHLVAWDGNLYMSVGLVPLTAGGTDELARALPQLVISTLTRCANEKLAR